MADLWTTERTERLTALWTGSTMTAAGIAAELGGITRNAVIGKVHRLGLPHRTPGGANGLPRSYLPTKPRQQRKPRAPAMFKPTNPPAPPPIPEPSGAHRCDLMGLTNASCRFPVTENSPFMFCGEPTADLIGRQVYCPYHTLMARRLTKNFSVADRERRRLRWKRLMAERGRDPSKAVSFHFIEDDAA